MALKLRKATEKSRKSRKYLMKVVSIYFWICVLFLSAPVSNSNSKCLKLKKVVHLGWCLLVITSTLVATYLEYKVFNGGLPDVQKFLYLSEYLLNVIIVIVTPLVSYLKQRFFDKVLSEMSSIDKDLSRIVKNLEYKELTKFFYIYLIFLSIFIGTSLPTLYFYQGKELFGFLRSSVVYIVPNLVNSLQLGQYYAILIFIRVRMTKIIAIIEKLDFELKDSSEELTSLRIVFSKLEYLHFKVSQNASPITGITFLSVFLITSIQLFVFYQDIAENKIRNLDLSLFSLIWLCLHFGKVLCVYWFNSAISKGRNFLTDVLDHHNNLNSNEYSITRFVLQMMMDRKPYSCGVIELNMQDIKLFVMNISIYVIFLIQYDLILKTYNTVKNDPKKE
ncbi:Gr59f family protein [Megaselia abdita]